MEKILQFGEGGFLRAFAEYFIQTANNNGENIKVAICQPRKNTEIISALNLQDCKYNIYLKGRKDGKIIDDTVKVDCVSRCIDSAGDLESLKKLFISDDLEFVISNTTEAGICFHPGDAEEKYPDISFPAKMAYLLHHRFKNGCRGLIFLPVELIEDNGAYLKKCVLDYADIWNYGKDFTDYVNNECSFCNTLVDRIVTGHTDGDADACSVVCEPYAGWIIETDDKTENDICFAKYSSEIVFCKDLKPYRQRKVKILNGAHTMSVPAALMCGFDIVRDVMNDKLFKDFIDQGHEEIKATIEMPETELDNFADSVKERFNNPFIDHRLSDISLNSISKFKVRCLPSILDYIRMNAAIPKILTFSFAALIAFYTHKGTERVYAVNDSGSVVDFFDGISQNAVKSVLSNKDFWDMDLTLIPDFEDKVADYYDKICTAGIKKAVEEVVNE